MTHVSKSWPCWTVRHVEAVAELARARLELEIAGWREVLDDADRRARNGEPGIGTAGSSAAEQIELALYRSSRLIPEATCIHRAIAGQRMLQRRGLNAWVVIGLSGGDSLSGHAWLEIDGNGEATHTLFGGDEAVFRRVK